MHRMSFSVVLTLTIFHVDTVLSKYECWKLFLVLHKQRNYSDCAEQCKNLQNREITNAQLAVLPNSKTVNQAINLILKNHEKRTKHLAKSFLIGLQRNQNNKFKWNDSYYDSAYYPQPSLQWKTGYPDKSPNQACVVIEIGRTINNFSNVFLLNTNCYESDSGCLCQAKNNETENCLEILSTFQEATLFGIPTVWVTIMTGTLITFIVLLIPSKYEKISSEKSTLNLEIGRALKQYETQELFKRASRASRTSNLRSPQSKTKAKANKLDTIVQEDADPYTSTSD